MEFLAVIRRHTRFDIAIGGIADLVALAEYGVAAVADPRPRFVLHFGLGNRIHIVNLIGRAVRHMRRVQAAGDVIAAFSGIFHCGRIRRALGRIGSFR